MAPKHDALPAVRWRQGAALVAALLVLTPAMARAAGPAKAPPEPRPTPAAAATQEPSSTTATYGDWVVRCRPRPGAAARSRLCEVMQGIEVKGRTGLVAEIVLGRIKAASPLHLVVQLPLGVWLPTGATLYLDAKTETGLLAPFTICARGCLANVALPTDLRTALETAAGPGRLEFEDGTRKRVVLPVSFRGLKAALDAGAAP